MSISTNYYYFSLHPTKITKILFQVLHVVSMLHDNTSVAWYQVFTLDWDEKVESKVLLFMKMMMMQPSILSTLLDVITKQHVACARSNYLAKICNDTSEMMDHEWFSLDKGRHNDILEKWLMVFVWGERVRASWPTIRIDGFPCYYTQCDSCDLTCDEIPGGIWLFAGVCVGSWTYLVSTCKQTISLVLVHVCVCVCESMCELRSAHGHGWKWLSDIIVCHTGIRGGLPAMTISQGGFDE